MHYGRLTLLVEVLHTQTRTHVNPGDSTPFIAMTVTPAGNSEEYMGSVMTLIHFSWGSCLCNHPCRVTADPGFKVTFAQDHTA